FTACKKDDAPKNTDTEAEVKAHNEDQNFVSSEMDAVVNEANVALESDASFSGKMMGQQDITNICGATAVADTSSNPWKITITYNGNNCFGTHHRSGTVVLSMPAGVRWKDAGAALTINVQNLIIKRLSDNKQIKINGTHTVTNVSGGLLYQLPVMNPITHTINGNLSITFGDNTQRNWQVSRKRVYTYNNGAVMTIHGTGTQGNNTQLAEWGTNRFGNAFFTSVTQPLVFRQDCNLRLTSGEIKHQGFATSTVTFGLDASGNPTSCPGSGNYYYKLVWNGPNGGSHQAINPY
ncbi:MAG: hypothetical protein ACXWV0_09400, partial [Flavisolibacter sp.]